MYVCIYIYIYTYTHVCIYISFLHMCSCVTVSLPRGAMVSRSRPWTLCTGSFSGHSGKRKGGNDKRGREANNDRGDRKIDWKFIPPFHSPLVHSPKACCIVAVTIASGGGAERFRKLRVRIIWYDTMCVYVCICVVMCMWIYRWIIVHVQTCWSMSKHQLFIGMVYVCIHVCVYIYIYIYMTIASGGSCERVDIRGQAIYSFLFAAGIMLYHDMLWYTAIYYSLISYSIL